MSEFPPPSLKKLAQEVFELLSARKETVSVMETVGRSAFLVMINMLINQAAGGLISACLLSVPGASAIYKGGLTVITFLDSCYNNPRNQ